MIARRKSKFAEGVAATVWRKACDETDAAEPATDFVEPSRREKSELRWWKCSHTDIRRNHLCLWRCGTCWNPLCCASGEILRYHLVGYQPTSPSKKKDIRDVTPPALPIYVKHLTVRTQVSPPPSPKIDLGGVFQGGNHQNSANWQALYLPLLPTLRQWAAAGVAACRELDSGRVHPAALAIGHVARKSIFSQL